MLSDSSVERNWSWPAENSNSLSEPRVFSTKHLGFRLSFWILTIRIEIITCPKKNKDSYKCIWDGDGERDKCISGNQFENIPLPPKREVRSSCVFRLYDVMFETNQINIKQIQPHSHVRQNISTIWSWSAFEGIHPNKNPAPQKNPWSPNKWIFTSIPLPPIPPFQKKARPDLHIFPPAPPRSFRAPFRWWNFRFTFRLCCKSRLGGPTIGWEYHGNIWDLGYP